ncbi:hypothetical protein [Caloramator sp. Dgby_cultured_2]|nr:hypothetical protein [Caloramator sp. Dgby_cultured_2]WDU82015.1 hypothetical protein PWK10_09350 [Caloramator sp. Dgby_cultured_2]
MNTSLPPKGDLTNSTQRAKIYRYPAGYVNIKIEDVIKEIIEKKK